jgi:hypothetical protein
LPLKITVKGERSEFTQAQQAPFAVILLVARGYPVRGGRPGRVALAGSCVGADTASHGSGGADRRRIGRALTGGRATVIRSAYAKHRTAAVITAADPALRSTRFLVIIMAVTCSYSTDDELAGY